MSHVIDLVWPKCWGTVSHVIDLVWPKGNCESCFWFGMA